MLSGRLTHLFVVVDDGDEALGVRPYNGGLFSDTEKPYLRPQVTNAYLARALYTLWRYISGKEQDPKTSITESQRAPFGNLVKGCWSTDPNLVIERTSGIITGEGGNRVYIYSQAGDSA